MRNFVFLFICLSLTPFGVIDSQGLIGSTNLDVDSTSVRVNFSVTSNTEDFYVTYRVTISDSDGFNLFKTKMFEKGEKFNPVFFFSGLKPEIEYLCVIEALDSRMKVSSSRTIEFKTKPRSP